jgi:hypothetical protein
MVVIDNPENYSFVKFVRSKTKTKKYDAVLYDKERKKFKSVPFGDNRYGQYKDTTGLGLYSHKDTLDETRRENYRRRHEGEDKAKFSSGYFALKYLW